MELCQGYSVGEYNVEELDEDKKTAKLKALVSLRSVLEWQVGEAICKRKANGKDAVIRLAPEEGWTTKQPRTKKETQGDEGKEDQGKRRGREKTQIPSASD